MLLGITEQLQEKNKSVVKRNIGVATTAFCVSLFLPFILYALFYFGIISGKSPFRSDIQEPVAKVITGTGVGTAFLITPTTLLTARHVVEDRKVGDQVDLIFERVKNQKQVKATIKYIATSSIQSTGRTVPLAYFLTDVAVLEVSEIMDISPLELGDSDIVQNLDEVILAGYPNGDYSITKGNINSDTYQGLNLFKLDATSNAGNSGGPCILKNDNRVIGILVGSSTIAQQGENVALKINDVKRILDNAGVNY
jgi:S1-C subfamily serine protease